MRILHVDTNHPLLWNQLQQAGFANEADYTASKADIQARISAYEGLVIRSRFPIDTPFLDAATGLKFIARLGAGLENIDIDYAQQKGIKLFSAPEGNRNAVGEHALGMLLNLMNKLSQADRQVRSGIWDREGNRGWEIEGRTVGIIGYGNMGKAFAKKLQGFDCQVLCHDILDDVGDDWARQVSLEELQQQADILSLHTPLTPITQGMVNQKFIDQFAKPFWLINTARGKSVITQDLVAALESGKILGAGLDVLEYEKSSFESLFDNQSLPAPLLALIQMENVLLSPHVAGWTVESKEKLAQTIVDKILTHFQP